MHHSECLPEQGAFFVRQSDKFIALRVCCCVVSADDMGQTMCIDSAYINVAAWPISRASLERVLCVCERGLGIAKQPQRPRPIGQDCHPDVLAKSRRQRTMLGRIVKRDRLIEMRSAFRDVSRTQQGHAHEAMPDHERNGRPLLLGERQELRRKLAHHVAVERHKVRDPEAVEDREQQQRVFGRLSERFSLFDQQTCPLHGRFGFRRGIPFDMDEGVYERDLKLDLLATQRGRGGQGRDLVKGARELLGGFDQRRTLQRPLSSFAPQARSLLDQSGLGAVTRKQFGLVLGNLGELAFECSAMRA